MRSRILIAGMCVGLIVGCSERTAQNAAPAPHESARATPQPAPLAPTAPTMPADKVSPSRLPDPPKIQPAPVSEQLQPAPPPKPAGKPSVSEVPGPVPAVKPNPMPDPVPPHLLKPAAPTPGSGTGKPAPAAADSPAAATARIAPDDMRDIHLFIDAASLASGQMPARDDVLAALVTAGSPAAERVKSGAIVVTGATTRESVWAYEAGALTNGGLVVTQNGTETLTTAQLKKQLGK
jgi:hypothetical protein